MAYNSEPEFAEKLAFVTISNRSLTSASSSTAPMFGSYTKVVRSPREDEELVGPSATRFYITQVHIPRNLSLFSFFLLCLSL